MIPGGNGDAGPFERVAQQLGGRFKVVTYDRRGYSRSTLDGPPGGERLDADCDDARRLIDHLGAPAHVFGSSSGAIVGLTLAARHPQSVRRIVAHEPPLMTLVLDKSFLAIVDEVYDTYLRAGPDAGMQRFSAEIGLSGFDPGRPPELPPQLFEMVSRIRRNSAFFLEHELRQYVRIAPDIVALQAAGARVSIAVGKDSREHAPYQAARALAEKLGTEPVEFPGGHLGYMTQPVEFAATLAALFS
jgi:pimeloyl-ACP methyl ester carboxylesterase